MDVELAPGVTLYTDTGNFFGGKTREVTPLYAVQSGLSYTFAPGGWVALNAGYFKGGRTTVDEVEGDIELEGIRFGATLVLPVKRHQSVKLYSISGYNAHREHDFQPSASRGNIAGAAGTEPVRQVGCRRNLAPRARASLTAHCRLHPGSPLDLGLIYDCKHLWKMKNGFE